MSFPNAGVASRDALIYLTPDRTNDCAQNNSECRSGIPGSGAQAATAQLLHLRCSIPCTIRDISAGGARLTIQSALYVPDTFQLYVEIERIVASCRVVWRHCNEVGVCFVGEPVGALAKSA